MRVPELGIEGLAEGYARGALSPEDALQEYRARIEQLNSRFSAFLDLDLAHAAEAARQSAERWRKAAPLSPIDGVPIGVKANIAIEGLPWHAGIAAYRDRRAPRDAECVARLRAAGAVILGTLNMEEGALGGLTDNPWFGRTHNPWRIGFTAGGSSGGSAAAVAAGLCAAALGTDTLGSVRIPSAYCGVFGYKPARGTISNDGVIPLSSTFDQVGAHARSLEDCAALLSIISDQPVPAPMPSSAMNFALLDFSNQVDATGDVAEALANVSAKLQATGHRVQRVRLDYDFGKIRRRALMIVEREGAMQHAPTLQQNPNGFSPRIRDMLAWAAAQPAAKFEEARRMLAETATRITAQLAAFDALLLPTAPQTGFAFDTDPPANQADFTALANILNWPACAIPAGLSPDGLPLSIQVMARNDAMAFTAATTAIATILPIPLVLAEISH